MPDDSDDKPPPNNPHSDRFNPSAPIDSAEIELRAGEPNDDKSTPLLPAPSEQSKATGVGICQQPTNPYPSQQPYTQQPGAYGPQQYDADLQEFHRLLQANSKLSVRPAPVWNLNRPELAGYNNYGIFDIYGAIDGQLVLSMAKTERDSEYQGSGQNSTKIENVNYVVVNLNGKQMLSTNGSDSIGECGTCIGCGVSIAEGDQFKGKVAQDCWGRSYTVSPADNESVINFKAGKAGAEYDILTTANGGKFGSFRNLSTNEVNFDLTFEEGLASDSRSILLNSSIVVAHQIINNSCCCKGCIWTIVFILFAGMFLVIILALAFKE